MIHKTNLRAITKLWLEINIIFSESNFIRDTLNPGTETVLGTQKSFLHVLNMGLGGAEENVNGVSKVAVVQTFVFWKFFCFTILLKSKFEL